MHGGAAMWESHMVRRTFFAMLTLSLAYASFESRVTARVQDTVSLLAGINSIPSRSDAFWFIPA